MFLNKLLFHKKTPEQPVQNRMQIILWYCRFHHANLDIKSQNRVYTIYLLLIGENFLNINFREPPKTILCEHYFRNSNKNSNFMYINFRELRIISIWEGNNFAKIIKMRATRNISGCESTP